MTAAQTPAIDEGDFLTCCLNWALENSVDWLVFSHDEAIHPTWLEAGILAEGGRADCLYWDEDRFIAGAREEPFFKPAWSPETWLGVDLLDTFAIRVSVFKQALPQRSLATLKAWIAANCHPDHIPQVWTHLSTTETGARQRLGSHLQSVDLYLNTIGAHDVVVRLEATNTLQTSWAAGSDLVSIIIPTRDNLVCIRRTVDTLVKLTAYRHYEIILVDNGSIDREVLNFYDDLKTATPVRILPYNRVFNFSEACNLGASAANGKFLLFLNNDMEITQTTWLEELVRVTSLPGVGISGARLLYPDGTIQHMGIVVGMTGHANHPGIRCRADFSSPFGPTSIRRNCSAVTGACLMVRHDVFKQVNGFDPGYSLVFNDVDFCLRVLRAGWRIVMTPCASLIHFEGQSRARHIPPENLYRAGNGFAEYIQTGDPYYSPNLSLAVTSPRCRSRLEMSAFTRMRLITEILGHPPV